MSECIARVNNIPIALPVNAIEELLKHVGATSIRVLCGRHKKKAALATFPDASIRDIACTRINKMCLADHKLEATPYAAGSSEVKPPLPANNEKIAFQPVADYGRRQPTPIAPHLGLNYPPSPFLEYKYPKATTDIVVNIANALMALPKFYTQVLHLMNKMNLPPPFEKDIIRGPFSDLKEEETNKKQNQVFQESDDDEDGEDDVLTTSLSTPQQNESLQEDSSHQLNQPPSKRLKKTKKSIVSSVPPIFTEPSPSGTLIPRPGVISEAELNRTRLTTEQLAQEKHMKNYTQGLPSCVLYVKNIAKSIDESDLRYVFGCVFPSDTTMGLMSIKLFKEGRLKGQAFIEYPSQDLATLALQTIHGVCLENKPLIVCYRKPPPS